MTVYLECNRCKATDDESKEKHSKRHIHDISVAMVREQSIMWGGQLCEPCRALLQQWLITPTEVDPVLEKQALDKENLEKSGGSA